MKANMYLKIAGILFLVIGTMELWEQQHAMKEKKQKTKKEESEELSGMKMPFRELKPLVRIGQA